MSKFQWITTRERCCFSLVWWVKRWHFALTAQGSDELVSAIYYVGEAYIVKFDSLSEFSRVRNDTFASSEFTPFHAAQNRLWSMAWFELLGVKDSKIESSLSNPINLNSSRVPNQINPQRTTTMFLSKHSKMYINTPHT